MQDGAHMSKLQSNMSAEVTVKLDPWVNAPPDFYDMTETYKQYGRLKAAEVKKKREIDRVEDDVKMEQERPRSNDAKKAMMQATSKLKDELADLQAELAEVESAVKALEFRKVMFNAANFRMRMSYDF